jgi:uncharacterized membrane protein
MIKIFMFYLPYALFALLISSDYIIVKKKRLRKFIVHRARLKAHYFKVLLCESYKATYTKIIYHQLTSNLVLRKYYTILDNNFLSYLVLFRNSKSKYIIYIVLYFILFFLSNIFICYSLDYMFIIQQKYWLC